MPATIHLIEIVGSILVDVKEIYLEPKDLCDRDPIHVLNINDLEEKYGVNLFG